MTDYLKLLIATENLYGFSCHLNPMSSSSTVTDNYGILTVATVNTHCKVGPPRIEIHNTSKGMNRYFLRIQRSKSDILTSKNEGTNSVLEICVCVSFM